MATCRCHTAVCGWFNRVSAKTIYLFEVYENTQISWQFHHHLLKLSVPTENSIGLNFLDS